MKYKIVVDKQSRTNPTSEKREYEVDIEELRAKGNVYDSLIFKVDGTYVMRRLHLSELQVLTILDEPIKEPLENVNIELFEGDNYIYLIDMEGNRFYAEYLIRNEFNEVFATRKEMNSAINLTIQEIDLAVNQKFTNYSTTEEMNASINIKADEINQVVSKKVGEDEIISKINQTAEAVSINASKVNLSGYVTISNLSTSGKTTINGGNITTGTIDASKVAVKNLSADNITSGTIKGRAISGGTITGTKITNGNNFSVDENGNLKANNLTSSNASITGGRLYLTGATYTYPSFKTSGKGLGDYSGDNTIYVDGMRTKVEDQTLINLSIGTDSNNRAMGGLSLFHKGQTSGWTDLSPTKVEAQTISQYSLKELKKNFEHLKNGLEIIKNIDIYKYNLKSEDDNTKKHIGFVIGDKYKYSQEVTSNKNDGVDIYSFVAVCCKAIQEQQEQIEQQNNLIQSLIERIEKLEAK